MNLKSLIILISVTYYHTSILYITWSWYNGFWCFPCDPYFWTELIYSVGRTLLVLIPLLFKIMIGLRDQCEFVNESGKHCSHEKILILLTSSLCFPMSLTHISLWKFLFTMLCSTSKLILHQYACMLVHQRHYWLYLKQEMLMWEWVTCLCCFFFSDIPRIPDTSHPPLESSRYPLREVGTSLYLYVCIFLSISGSYLY